MRIYVEPSPAGGYNVKLEGHPAPISHHDTEEDAEARAAAYARGAARGAADGEEVTLKDGSRVVIRPVRPEDKALFVEGFERFGEESRHRRFMGFKKRLSPEELAFLTHVDHSNHEALGARDAETGQGVGVARFLRLERDPEVAEAAVAIVDDWQGRGLGGTLLERLTERARGEGIRRFRASLFTDNRDMLRLFARVGTVRVTDRSGDELEVDVELPLGEGAAVETALRAAAAGDAVA